MGFIDNVKGSIKDSSDRAAERKGERGRQLAVVGCEYIGGYGTQQKSAGRLTFYERRVEFAVPMSQKRSFEIPMEDLADIAVEGKAEVGKRVTVTRLVAVGLFAFAFKKRTEDKESFVTLVLQDGQEAVFHVTNKSPLELKPKLAAATSAVRSH